MIVRGSQVVCIADRWNIDEHPTIICPKEGRIYTVRDIREEPEDLEVPCALLLEEIRNPVFQWVKRACEPYFDIRWFRPVPKTDIGIFTAMLKPVKENA